MENMRNCSQGWWIFSVTLLLALSIPYSQAYYNEKKIKSAVFLSPKFVLGPGSIENKFYYNIDFPRGHIALKSFDAEVIDEAGNPVPLHETYLHHWVVERYYGRVEYSGNRELLESDSIIVRNDGICQKSVLGQYFGLGSETRGTETFIPDPYGIEIGNPAEIPVGYEDRWMLNVHAIDTRGVEDKLGCTECKCNLYNVTVDEYGRPLRPDYNGGLLCCYDHTQCRVRRGFEGARRSLYLRYTVKWFDWDYSIVPVKIYIFDVTDTWETFNDSTGLRTEHDCLVEYEVQPCSATNLADECIHTKRTSVLMTTGGYVIYGVAHQHSGGIASALYREDGEAICTSVAAYGNGTEAGNEAGYIVGMSTCYPQPGSVKVSDGETLILESNYSSTRGHTGVMGLFYILVADRVVAEHMAFLNLPLKMYNNANTSAYVWAAIVLLGVVCVAVAVHYGRRNRSEDGYQSMI